MKNQIKRPKSIKNKMIIPLAFHLIDFDWVCFHPIDLNEIFLPEKAVRNGKSRFWCLEKFFETYISEFSEFKIT